MSTITIPQLPDSNNLDRNDYIIIYNTESSPDVLTYKGRVGDVLDLINSIDSVNGKTGSTITLNPDDLNDSTTLNKFVTATDKTKIAIIRTDQGSGTFLSGDGTYRTPAGGSSGNNNYTVNTITDRNALTGLANGDRVLVIDASGDPAVGTGAALYYWNSGTGAFKLIADSISIQLSISGLTSSFHTYTGTTAPNTYLTKTSFNSYSGTTNTAINNRLLKTTFNGYTGTTAPATYQSKTSINILTGSTLPTTYETKSAFNTYTGTTNTRINAIESNYVTGATNGLSVSGKKIKFGGTLTGATIIGGSFGSSATALKLNPSYTVTGTGSTQIALDIAPSFAGGTTPVNYTAIFRTLSGSVSVPYGGIINGEQMLISAGQNATTRMMILNSTNGTSASAQYLLSTSSIGASTGSLTSYAAGFSTSNIKVANTIVLESNLAGGTNIGSNNGAQVSLWTSGIKRLGIDSTGVLTVGGTGVTSSMIYTPSSGLRLQSQGISLNGDAIASQAIKGISAISTASGNQTLTFTYGSHVETAGTNYVYRFQSGSMNPTSGNATINAMSVEASIAPLGTQSGGTFNQLNIAPTYNFTGRTNTAVGINYNPTLTGVVGLTHYGLLIRPAASLSGFGTATPTATVQINGNGSNPALKIVGAGTTTNFGINYLQSDATTPVLQVQDNGSISSSLKSNNITGLLMKRSTDTSPTGNFIDLQSAASSSIFKVDVAGNLTASSSSATFSSITPGQIVGGGGGLTVFTSQAATNGLSIQNGNDFITAGTTRNLLNLFQDAAHGFRFPSGTNRGTALKIKPLIQNTGGTNTIIGIDYNPTETALTGTTHYAFLNQSTTAKSAFGLTGATAMIDVAGSSTNRASLRIRSGTAPTSPNDGEVWYDGTNLKMRIGGVTKTFTLT